MNQVYEKVIYLVNVDAKRQVIIPRQFKLQSVEVERSQVLIYGLVSILRRCLYF